MAVVGGLPKMATPSVAVVTLAVGELRRSRAFYAGGFGWEPVFENDEIIFYQMNGLVLGTWLETAMAADMGRSEMRRPGAFALAHNVRTREDVEPLIDVLIAAGGSLLRAPVAPAHGGYAGYVADPDDHAWEIAWNPAWPIDAEGHVAFGV